MKNTNTLAAIVLAMGMVISSWILFLALSSLGRSIEHAGRYAKPDPVRVPSQLRLQGPTTLELRLQNSPGGSSLKIETSEKNK